MSDQEPKQERRIILKDRNEQRVQSPTLWLVLLAIPVVLGLLISMGRDENAPPPERPTLPDLAEAGGRGQGKDSVAIDNPIISPVPKSAPAQAPSNEVIECDFAQWVGQEPSQQMVDALKGASAGERPYRILPPGSMMTMDHNPNRVNFDVDDAGTITRVWCG